MKKFIMAETENKSSQKDKKKRVKALFSYNPVNMDELQLKVNDVLEVIEETEEGWWKGVLNGAVGMFPSNFVIELDNLPEDLRNHTMNELSPTKSLTRMKNVEAHESSLKHEISHSPSTKVPSADIKSCSLSSNNEDSVDLPKIPDSIDRKGSVNKKNVDSTAPRLPPKPVREQARVIYPYTALNEDELSLKEGDIITVISKEVEDKGWWKGELNNRTGVFPDNFVQLIKVEEQKKPERPDKPPSALTSRGSLKSASSDKTAAEFSPKSDRKMNKIPPVKPPPPEIHKKEHERPVPPFPTKKPQIPHPMKKPSRSSLGSKFSGFTPTTAMNSSVKPPVPEIAPGLPPGPPPIISTPAKSTNVEPKSEVSKTIEKFIEKEDKREPKKEDKREPKKEDKREPRKEDKREPKKDDKREPKKEDKREPKKEDKRDIKKEDKRDTKKEDKRDTKKEDKRDTKKEDKRDTKKEDKRDSQNEIQDLGFEGLESSGKKLVHLTANRAKVPNRRPPSHIFLRETEKENGIFIDPRRLSEPLLSEMKFIHPAVEVESYKTNLITTNETKAKVPPSRPLPPSIKGNKPAIQGSVVLTKTISSEECIVKAPEPIKVKPQDMSTISTSEILQPKKMELHPSDFKIQSSDKEIQELKESIAALKLQMVSRNEFNELSKQVKELKENMEKSSNTSKKTINDLKNELESERKKRQALEMELQQMKECQTT